MRYGCRRAGDWIGLSLTHFSYLDLKIVKSLNTSSLLLTRKKYYYFGLVPGEITQATTTEALSKKEVFIPHLCYSGLTRGRASRSHEGKRFYYEGSLYF